jgi:uncharacterized protein
MVIDIHAHVFLDSHIKFLKNGTPFMTAEQQIALMDEKGIDKAVILPLNNAEAPAEKQSTGEVLTICEKYPGRFIPFSNVDPRWARRPEDATLDDYLFLLGQHKELGFKGLGELTARIEWDHPLMLLLLEACEQLELPITFHSITPNVNSYGVLDEMGLPLFEKVVRRFPNLIFLGHSPGFWSEISGQLTIVEKNGYATTKVEPGGKLIEILRNYPNVNCDVSAGSGLNAFTRDPEHAFQFLDEFQDRVCLGLDYCSPTNNMTHLEWFTEQRDAGNISEEVFQKVVWKNANRLLKLEIDE